MGTRIKSVVALVLLVLLINLPLLHSSWIRWEVERDGIPVTVPLLDHEVLGSADDPAYWLLYRLPDDIDPDGERWPAQVDEAAYDDAVRAGQVTVRVLDDEPATARVDGQVVGRAGLVTTLAADLALLGFAGVLWRFGRYRRAGVVRIEAVSDVGPGAGGGRVEEGDGLVLVTGLVTEVTADGAVIDAGDRVVVVVLDGHSVLVPPGQPGQVRGRWL